MDDYGDDGEQGCDGWGEPDNFCISPLNQPDPPDWLTEFPEYLEWHVFQAASTVFIWWAKVPEPNLTGEGEEGSESAEFLQDGTSILVVFSVGFSILIVAGRTAVARDGAPVKEAMKPLVGVVLVSGLAVTIGDRLVVFVDDFSSSYILQGLNRGTGDNATAELQDATVIYLAGMDSTAGFAILDVLAAVIAIITSLTLFVYFTLRYFLIIYYIGTAPLIAALAATGEGGMRTAKQQAARAVAVVLSELFVTVTFVTGFHVAGELQGGDTMRVWMSVIIFAATAFVPFALTKASNTFAAHIDDPTPGNGAAFKVLATGAMALGAAAAGTPKAIHGAAKVARGTARAAQGAARAGSRAGSGALGAVRQIAGRAGGSAAGSRNPVGAGVAAAAKGGGGSGGGASTTSAGSGAPTRPPTGPPTGPTPRSSGAGRGPRPTAGAGLGDMSRDEFADWWDNWNDPDVVRGGGRRWQEMSDRVNAARRMDPSATPQNVADRTGIPVPAGADAADWDAWDRWEGYVASARRGFLRIHSRHPSNPEIDALARAVRPSTFHRPVSGSRPPGRP
ncbi:hypothetical protein LO772_07855 [Yinghuangia sp. ASG 101]|uniref:hypothetical protein n=1 Tax=Yinghuangia sp. ASG 101 TaxID=2896848 RepID=UPI001E5B667A|nr:hypothetical protein [Yinghuangia sp. ASG 101]UGQ13510.1 hypothetical protein LO772_07855 [Yinghuangia sp. ASG 101]